jgi:hypothetical protein
LRIRRDCRVGGAGISIGRNPHPHVNRDGADGIGEQRIDVELADLWVVRSQLGEPAQHLDDRIDIGRRFAPVALQQLPYPRPCHQAARQQDVQRRELE